MPIYIYKHLMNIFKHLYHVHMSFIILVLNMCKTFDLVLININIIHILQGANFVEERRKKLQVYLRQIINFLITINRILANCPNKYKLVSLVPFFRYVNVENNSIISE